MNKNTQSGFIIPLIIGIVALFIIAGGVYFAYEKGKSAEVNQVNTSVIPAQAGIQSQTSGSNSSTSTSTEPTPIITSINPTSAKIGDTVAVSGSNLRGFEGDKNLWIQNVSSGVKGIIHGDAGASDQSIKFNLTDKYCTAETSYSGNACPSYLTITPGNYVVYANPWGVTSNSVPLLITSTSSTAWQTYTNSQYGYTLQYPYDFALVSNMTSAQKSLTSSYMGSCHELNASYSYSTPGEVSLCYIGSQTTDGFSASAFNISASSTTSVSDCQKTQQNENGQQTKLTTINGIPFYEDMLGDAGLGHYVSTDSFRTYHAGKCYTIEADIESQVGNAPYWNGLDPTFLAGMKGKLDQILSTFHFTSTATSSIQPSITVISPNGGESFNINSPIPVSWSQNYSSSSIKVCLLGSTGGCLYTSPSMNAVVGQNSFTIPATANRKVCTENNGNSSCSLAGGYKITILDTNPPPSVHGDVFSVSSDNYFTITNN